MALKDQSPTLTPDQQVMLDDLFRRHHKRLYQFCVSITQNPATAQDLEQTAYLKLGQRLTRGNLSSVSIGYLRTIVKREFIKQLQDSRLTREQTFSLPEEYLQDSKTVEQTEIDGASWNLYVEEQESQRSKDLALEHQKSMLTALNSLPEDKRDLLVKWVNYSEFFNDPIGQIAEELGIPRPLIAYKFRLAVKCLRYWFSQAVQK